MQPALNNPTPARTTPAMPNRDVAGAQFVLQQLQCVVQQCMQVTPFPHGSGRPNRMQELFQNHIQPLDFASCRREVFLQRRTVTRR